MLVAGGGGDAEEVEVVAVAADDYDGGDMEAAEEELVAVLVGLDDIAADAIALGFGAFGFAAAVDVDDVAAACSAFDAK